MTTPQYGNCRDCAALGDGWECQLSPKHVKVFSHAHGCWSFIPKVEKRCETCEQSLPQQFYDCEGCSRFYKDRWTPKKETK